ncbi:MAG: SBBP repeat-containing protein [Deltaproteobacteria bacterium]|nr:SBBP repeat-containing protein [Deltaproteobacteria bacterium]
MKKIVLFMFFISGCSFNSGVPSGIFDDFDEICGNGKVEGSEICDGSDLNGNSCYILGYESGDLGCWKNCTFNTSRCTGIIPTCGNNVKEPTEDCDGINIPDVSCDELGLGEGTIKCTDTCRLDVTACSGYTHVCGDSMITGEEECDLSDIGGNTCEDLGWYDGIVTCNSECRLDITDCEDNGWCGNEIADTPFEECEGSDMAGETCESLGYYGGNLSCSDNCTFNISDCENYGWCGDNILDSTEGEVCDGEAEISDTCQDLGYYGGELYCNNDCQYNTLLCEIEGRCGDGAVQEDYGEDCDGVTGNLGTCQIAGFFAGVIGCRFDCAFDVSTCVRTAQWGTSSGDKLYDIIKDEEGRILVSGRTQGDLYDENIGGRDAVVAKFDIYGNIIWGVQYGSTGDERAYGVTVDDSGDIFVAGRTNGNFDGNTRIGGDDIFLSKISSDGSVIWSIQEGSDSNDYAVDAFSDDGNVYITGRTQGDLAAHENAGGNDVFLLKYDNSGNRIWAFQDGTSDDDEGYALTVDVAGDILVCGRTQGDFHENISSGGDDFFIMKINSDGYLVWARQYGTSGNDVCSTVYADSQGFIYVAGYTNGSFPGFTAAGNNDLFVAKLSISGDILWYHQNGNNQVQSATSITGDSQFVYVSGSTVDGIDDIPDEGQSDVFISTLTVDGSPVESVIYGGPNNEYGNSMVRMENGNLCIAGYTNGLFGESSSGGDDMFVFCHHN